MKISSYKTKIIKFLTDWNTVTAVLLSAIVLTVVATPQITNQLRNSDTTRAAQTAPPQTFPPRTIPPLTPPPQLGIYPRELLGTNPQLKMMETKARSGNTVYLQLVSNSSKNITQVDWYINDRWTTYDKQSPFFLSSNFSGTNNGFVISPGTIIRAVAYYDYSWNYLETKTTYNY